MVHHRTRIGIEMTLWPDSDNKSGFTPAKAQNLMHRLWRADGLDMTARALTLIASIGQARTVFQ
jgi:hypothetical protein